MSKKKVLNLKASKPAVSHLNKPLICLAGGVVALIILFSILSAFQQSKKRSKQVMQVNIGKPIISNELSELPSNYTEKNKILKFAVDAQKTSALEKELNELKQSQKALQENLAALQHSPSTIGQSNNLNQASHSAIFFLGGAPNTQKTNAPKIPQKNAPYPHPSDYQQQNMQNQKIKFLNEDQETQASIYNTHKLVKPISPYEVQAGTLIPSVLLTSVNTSLPGEVVARVRNDVYNSVTGRYLLIPQGSKLIGQYDSQISYGQNRVLIVFKRLIRPDGSSILFTNAPGSDLFGQAGMQGNINNHWGRVIGAAVLSTILSLGSGAVADNSFSNNNAFYRSTGQNALLGAGANVSQVGQNLTNRAMNIQPILMLPAGYEFNIIVNKDMVLQPYHVLPAMSLPGDEYQ